MVISFVLLLVVVFSKRLKRSYQSIERQFMDNLNGEAEDAEKKERWMLGVMPFSDVHLADFELSPNSSLIGKTLREVGFRQLFGINIVAITRGETRINIPAGREILCAFDKITVVGTDREIEAFRECVAQREREREKKISARKNMNVYIEQFVVEEGSPLVGHSINEVGLRDKVACLIIGIERKGEAIMNPASTFVFEAEDVVWVVGELRSILRLSGEQRVALSKKR